MKKQILLLIASVCTAFNTTTQTGSLGGLVDSALGVASDAVNTAADATTGLIATARDRIPNDPNADQVIIEHRYYPDGEGITRREVIHNEGPGHESTIETTTTTETFID